MVRVITFFLIWSSKIKIFPCVQHIEQACALLRKDINAGDKYEGVAVLDFLWGYLLQKKLADAKGDLEVVKGDDTMTQYFDGKLPEKFPTGWADVDRVLAPWNLKNEHWVALDINFAEWTLDVYDCDTSHVADRHMPGLLKAVTHLFPILMNGHPELRVKWVGKVPEPLVYKRVKGISQNKQS